MERKTIRKLLLTGALVIIIGALGFFFARHAILNRINAVRAERLSNQAVEAYENESWEKASRLGTAAYYLNTEDADIQLLVAQALLKQRAAGAISWWKRILDHPDIPIDDLRTVTAVLLANRQLEDGLLFLNRLVELDPASPETQRLWLQSLEIQKRMTGVMELAGRMVEDGTDDWAVHRQYLIMQRAIKGDEGEKQVLVHLRELIQADSALSLTAARELASFSGSTGEDKLIAAEYLLENGGDAMDRLYGTSLEVQAGIREKSSLESLVNEVVATENEELQTELLRWAVWMKAPELVLDKVDFTDFISQGGSAEAYFDVLVAAGRYNDLIRLSEDSLADKSTNASIFLYYRALAYEKIGDLEKSDQTLNLAVQVADPENTADLERKLFFDQRWPLLIRLYDLLLNEEPDNPLFLQKYLAANYYLGYQDNLERHLVDIDLDKFESSPSVQAFILYLRTLTLGALDADHQRLQELLANYPDIFDYRLILGVSYLLRGEEALARGFLKDMPELTMNAPRFLRVCGVLLGIPRGDLINPAETEYLLPREQYLLSRYGVESTE